MSKKMRNFGIMAHIDAGKTTSTERILFFTGKSHRIGEVDDGNATMDWMEQEQNRGITITSAATTVYWKDYQLNIIDTPGHVDFTAEVERSLRVLDGAIAIFCAVGGVEPQSETVWHQADAYQVARIAYINKMDRIGANFDGVIEEMKAKFACRPIPICIPIGKENEFEGIIDILDMVELHWDESSDGSKIDQKPIRAELLKTAESYRDQLIDAITEENEELTEKVLNGQELTRDEIQAELRKLTLARKIIPLFTGASLRNIGVQRVLDGVIDYLPAPDELSEITAVHAKKETEYKLARSESGELAALVFKIQHDREAGPLCFIRVYAGQIESGAAVYNVNKKKRERVNRLLRMHANRSEQVEVLKAGDIGVIVGFKHAQTGDTIASEGLPLVLERMHFPEPVISQAIEPKTLSDRDKLKGLLDMLVKEDPTFFWREDKDTGELVISGMGELHLDVLATRITDEFKVPARIGKPQVTYRESITHASIHHEVFEKIIASKEQRAGIEIEVKPAARGMGNLFSFASKNLAIPEEIKLAIEAGIMGSLQSGIALGYPCVDIEVIVKSVDYNIETASEFAFEACASMGFDAACQKAGPVKLAPVMKVKVLVPSEYMGDVINSLTMRGGLVNEVESRNLIELIHAQAPLEAMFGYSTALRSMSQGRGTFSMEFSHYEQKN